MSGYMAQYADSNNIVRDGCRVAYDTLLFAGVKYSLHKLIDTSTFMAVNISDIMKFLVVDGIYYVMLRNKVAYYFSSPTTLNFFVSKYGVLILGVAILDIIFGNKNRAMSNAINIGLSGGAKLLVEQIVGFKEDRPSNSVA